MYLTQALHHMLQLEPDALATVCNGRRQSYAELTRRVARLGSALRGLGMQVGDRVGLLGVNSDRFLEYMYGTWWGGGVINPVNTRWSVPEIVYSLDDCDTHILLIDDTFLPIMEGIRTSARPGLVLIHAGDAETPDGMLNYEQLIAAAQPVEDVLRGGQDLAAILYTGGTTGHPKGVMQSHASVWSSCMARMAEYPIAADSVTLHTAPMFHGAAMARVVCVVIAGRPHVFVPSFDAVSLMGIIERERVTDTLLVPTMLQALISHPDFNSYDLSSLRRVTYGASPIAAALMERVLEVMPQIEFTQGYGMTEAFPPVTLSGPENHTAEAVANGRVRSAGRPSLAVIVRIVDAQGNEVPRGTVGEIIVHGPNLMQGYWNKPEETDEALRGGWMHTGDGGYMDDDGYLFIVDRLKDMIVSGGENVYSAEVENALSTHPAVAACAVIGIPDEKWGEAVHAVIVLKSGVEASAEEIIEHCHTLIAGYKCPKSVEFATSLPVSGAGKILKRDLREPYWKKRDRGVN